MKTTYDDILNAMKNAFYESCGEGVDLYSDIGARFQAVASELYSLACYEDFVLKQAFPQTATGKYLDYHAQLRSKARKGPQKASGILTFSIKESLEADVEIPSGTICSVKDKPFIQFETVEPAVISAGETYVDVNAAALDFGERYNVLPLTITVMVNPPVSVDRVLNNYSFVGGVDEESDEKLRHRVLKSYSVPQNGVTLNSISQSIENLNGVLDCVVYFEDSTYSVFVKTATNTIDQDLYEQIYDCFMLAMIFDHAVLIEPAVPKSVDLKITCRSNTNEPAKIKEKITEILTDCFESTGIGEPLNVERLIMSIAKIDEIENVELNGDDLMGGVIPLRNNEYLKLGKAEVVIYD